MSLHILFADVSRSRHPREYVQKKLVGFFRESGISRDCINSMVDAVFVEGNPARFPIADPERVELPKGEKERIIRKEIALFRELVDRRSPLLPDEKVESGSDVCTYLDRDYGAYRAGTPVLIRKTNLATLFYLYDRAIVDSEYGFSLPKSERTERGRNGTNGSCRRGLSGKWWEWHGRGQREQSLPIAGLAIFRRSG